ncbi:MAG: hypothetical protein JEZ14_15955 [Marinilabiliaceae bacterium]|nr:hypothetical protein [Marinilabiliaceae bacterium]
MKKFYVFLLISSFLASGVGKAQYTSTGSGGYFTDAGTWTGSAPDKAVDADFFINGNVDFDDDISIIGGDGNSAVNDGGYLEIQNGKTLILDTKDFYVKSGGILEITGDFEDDKHNIFVEEGGKLIVHGNMVLTKLGSQIAGTVVVLGDVELKNIEITASGILVVGGDLFEINAGQNNYGGSIYILDPDAIVDIPGSITADPGDVEDLYDDIGSFGEPIDDTLGDHMDELTQENNWQGDDTGAETQWMNDANWSGSTPDALDNIIIPSGKSYYPELSGDVTIAGLTVEAGAELTIAAGSSVTIISDVSIEGDFIVKNTVSQPTSVIVNGTVTGNVTSEWTYESGRYWYVGHTTSNPSIASYDAIVGDANNNDYVLYSYNGAWVNETGTATFSDPLTGYCVKVSEEGSAISHTGPLNSGDFSKTLSAGWQLIANPYASYYQLITDAGNGAEFINTTGDIYIRTGATPETRTYSTFNTVSGIGSPAGFSGIIAPSQSFWVKRSQAGDIIMSEENRVHDSALSSLKAARTGEVNTLRFKLNNSEDEMVIAFRQGAGTNFSRMDSEKRFDGNDQSYIYTIKDGISTVINVLPLDNANISIPIGINTLKGNHTLSISGVSSLEISDEIWLEDTHSGELIDMKAVSDYRFTTNDEVDESRFVLHLKHAVSTGIEELVDEETRDEKDEIIIYSKANIVKVKVEGIQDIESVNVVVYSIKGGQVVNETFNGNDIEIPLPVVTGHYIVKVKAKGRNKQLMNNALLVIRKL